MLIFFLSSILLYLPQNSFISANSDDQISSFNNVQTPTKILHTDAGETWLLPTGEFVYKTGSESTKRVFDETTKEWKPYIYEDLGNGNYQIQSGNIGTIFSGQMITHYDTKLIEQKAVEKLKFLKAEGGKYVEIPLTFVDRTMVILQKQVFETVSDYEVFDTVETVRIIENWNSDEGTIKIYYDFTEGEPLKHTFLVTPKNDGIFRLHHVFETDHNITLESVGVDDMFHTEQIRIDISQNNIKVVKDEKLMENNVQTTFLKKSEKTDVLRHVSVSDQADGSLLFGELVSPSKGNTAWQKFIGLNIDSSKDSVLLEFQYGDWVAGARETFELDPDTYSSNNPIRDEEVIHNSGATGTSCPGNPAFGSNDVDMEITVGDSDLISTCKRAFVEWDISTIPDNSDVINTIFKFEITLVNSPRNCDYNEMQVQPTTTNAQTVWDDIGNGTTFVDNNNLCTSVGTNKSLDLGTDADVSVEAHLPDDWWAIGIKADSEVRDSAATDIMRFATEEDTGATPKLTLEITYTTPATYSLSTLDVYKSNTRALDDGTAACIDINLTSASTCSTPLRIGHTYQFQLNVTNAGSTAGSPNSTEFRDVVASNDVLGSISATTLDTGCNDDGTDRTWTDYISTDDAIGTAGTTCTIESTSGWEIYYFITTIASDAANGTGTFFITDGTNTDTSTTTTFTVLDNVVTGSAEKGFTLAATADLSKQKNNIGTNYTDIYNGAFEPDFNLVNFTGYTKVRILSGWDYSPADTGNQTMRWVDANNNTRVLHETSTFTIDQDPNDSGWINLPTWATNETTIEWQGKSTVNADDPVAKYFRIFLR